MELRSYSFLCITGNYTQIFTFYVESIRYLVIAKIDNTNGTSISFNLYLTRNKKKLRPFKASRGFNLDFFRFKVLDIWSLLNQITCDIGLTNGTRICFFFFSMPDRRFKNTIHLTPNRGFSVSFSLLARVLPSSPLNEIFRCLSRVPHVSGSDVNPPRLLLRGFAKCLISPTRRVLAAGDGWGCARKAAAAVGVVTVVKERRGRDSAQEK